MREIPAHPAQASAYFVHGLADSPASQCVQLSLSLGERSTPEHLQAAWKKVAAAHGMLRSGFRKAATGELVRRELDAVENPWHTLDWKNVPPTEIPSRWTALLEEDAAKPIDLANPPLIRFAAIVLPGQHCHVLMTFPRLLLDEDSLFHLICEWLEALDGATPAPTENPEATLPAATPATADWWKQFFSGAPEPARLRVHPAPAPAATSHRHVESLLDRETSKSLKRLSQRLNITTSDLIFAAWGFLLGRLTSQRRVLLLAPCRLSESLDCGYFDNFLPAHLTINGGQSIEAFLKTVAREGNERAQNGFIPLERVLALPQPAQSPGQYAATFLWLPPPLNDRIHDTYPRWINSDSQLYRRPLFPLSLECRDGNRISLRLEYATSIFSAAEAERTLSRLTNLLDDFLGGPTRRLSELRVLTDAEWDSLKKQETAPSPIEAPSLVEQISSTVSQHPDAPAAEGPGEAVMSYAELDSLATSLAAWLRHENIADGWNIAVCLNQTAWLPVSILGIIRAGDTCVPLEPVSSASWLSQRLEGYDVELVICDTSTAPSFEGSSKRLLIIDQQWETVSGVTATAAVSQTPPKATFHIAGTESSAPPALSAITPAAAAKAIAATVDLMRLEPGCRLPLTAPAGTGAYIETVLAALASGAALQLVSDSEIPNSATHLRLTRGQWRVWLAARRQSGPLPKSLSLVCVDTGVTPPAVHTGWQTLNNGQVTWISVLSSSGLSGLAVRYQSPDRLGAFDPLEETPLGQAGPGTRAVLHDFEGQPLPPFFTGSIEITGEGDKKISLPGWRDPQGCFFLETTPTDLIERTLCAFEGVIDAHVAKIPDGELPAAWVVLANGSTDVPAGLREKLAAEGTRLQFLFAVPAYPLSASGEIDTASLPRPQAAPVAAPKAAAAKAPEPAPAKEWIPLTLLGKKTEGAPLLFLIHDIEGNPDAYRSLAGLMAGNWTVYATAARGLHQPNACHTSIEAEAASLVEAICLLDPAGPYHLVGYGFGGLLAFEMARQMRVARRDVPFLAIAGARTPEVDEEKPKGWLNSLTKAFLKAPKPPQENPSAGVVERAHQRALQNYRAQPLSGPAGLILAADQDDNVEEAWINLLPETFVERMSCNRSEMLSEPAVKRLGVILRDCLDLAEEEKPKGE